MNVNIPGELYSRMIEIPKRLDEAETRRYFYSLYIERKNKKLYVVATNIQIAAIQYLGENDGPDEATAIAIDDKLIEICDKETPHDGNISIAANTMLSYTAIKSTFGYQHPGNAFVQLPENHEFKTWRDWLPDKLPEKSHGVIYWNTYSIHALLLASPSGAVTFPEHIDTSIPVIIRDDNDPNWIAVYKPVRDRVAAFIPDWAK